MDYARLVKVYLVHTPFQALSACLIAKQLGKSCAAGSAPNVLITTYNKAAVDEICGIIGYSWSDICYLPSSMGSVLGGVAKENNKIIAQYLGVLGSEHRSVEVFLCDIAWPENNACFFSTRIELTKLGVDIKYNSIPDGLVNIFNPQMPTSQYLRDCVKYLSGLIRRSARYTPFLGPITGMGRSEFSFHYSFYEHTLLGDRCKQLLINPLIKLNAKRNPTRALIVGQPFGCLVGEDQYLKDILSIANLLKEKGVEEISYKKHHRESAAIDEILLHHGIRIVISNLLVELLVVDHSFSMIASINSSALINAKIFYGDDIRCLAYKPGEYAVSVIYYRNWEKKEIDNMFLTYGVDVHS